MYITIEHLGKSRCVLYLISQRFYEEQVWLLLLSCTIIIRYFRLLVSGKRGVDKGKSLKAVMQTATVSTVSNSESLEKDMVAPEGK
jgi:hypothetical protein